MSVGQVLEHAEHISHSGHGHGTQERLSTYIGITMAVLGVLLAFCSALVGSERTLLVQKMIEQQNAHAKYQAQNTKHRMAFLTLLQSHALGFSSATPTVRKDDMATLAATFDRYLAEAEAGREWTESFDEVIKIHEEAQEEFEHGLLAAEIGIIIASIALLLRRRSVWLVSLALGGLCIFLMATTWVHVTHQAREQAQAIAAKQQRYAEMRKKGNTDEADEKMVHSMAEWARTQ